MLIFCWPQSWIKQQRTERKVLVKDEVESVLGISETITSQFLGKTHFYLRRSNHLLPIFDFEILKVVVVFWMNLVFKKTMKKSSSSDSFNNLEYVAISKSGISETKTPLVPGYVAISNALATRIVLNKTF